jgi:hypothetical protein
MLTDKSEGFQDSWRFLNDRVEDAFYLKQQTDGLFNDLAFWTKNFETLWGMNPLSQQKQQGTSGKSN